MTDTKSSPQEWTPSNSVLEGEMNIAIEDIKNILQRLQKEIHISDRYILHILEIIADEYRPQSPSGKS